jgi:hypothetical protein
MYEEGDMVKFTLTAYNAPKVFTGVISDVWGTIPHDAQRNVYVYTINCLEKNMSPFSISEVLIISKV